MLTSPSLPVTIHYRYRPKNDTIIRSTEATEVDGTFIDALQGIRAAGDLKLNVCERNAKKCEEWNAMKCLQTKKQTATNQHKDYRWLQYVVKKSLLCHALKLCLSSKLHKDSEKRHEFRPGTMCCQSSTFEKPPTPSRPTKERSFRDTQKFSLQRHIKQN